MQFIEGGTDVFRALAYSFPNSRDMEAIRERSAYNTRNLTARARERFDEVRNRHVKFDIGTAKRRVRAAMRKAGSYWEGDTIRYLDTIGRLQHPPNKMIRYLMAEPEVRRRWQANRCEGYGERYVDEFPNDIGESDPIYRTVMDGMWVEDSDGNLGYTEYWMTEEMDDETDLDFEDKLDIINSWDKLKQFFDEADEDPTSPYNARL